MRMCHSQLRGSLREQRRRGFNLIEAAIVLGVVGLVIGGIWVAASSVNDKIKMNQAVAGVNIITKNVQGALHAFGTTTGQMAYSNPIYFTGADGYVLPTGGYRQDPWGHDIGFDEHTSTTWFIGFYDLTVDRCIGLVSGVSASYETNLLWRMDVPSGSSETTFPINVADAATFCAGGGTLYMYFNI